MQFNSDEKKLWSRLCRKLRTFPSFSKIKTIRRCKLTTCRASVTWDGTHFRIYLSDVTDFDNCLLDLAHECAHILVDMENEHNIYFRLAENFMIYLLRQIIEEVSQ